MMKVLFLHLSDAHLKEDTMLSNLNIQAIIKSLVKIGEFDKCILVFSGDITKSGKQNEYKVAEHFFGMLIKGIKDRYSTLKNVLTFIVPGNHDMVIKEPKRDVAILKEYYKDNKLDEHYYNELEQLSYFYKFANRNKCYCREKIIDSRRIQIDNLSFKINLINSAPFSILGGDNGDKGMHYIPEIELDKLSSNNGENFTISIIHHGPEWFSDKSKENLYEKLYSQSDLIFVGHDHYSKNENTVINGNNKVDISTGIALYGTKKEQGYNAIILDTEKKSLLGYKFVYNGSIYKPIESPILNNQNVIFRGKNKFTHTESFVSFLSSDVEQREGDKYLNYFVFPTLELKDINQELKNYKISTIEEFVQILPLNKIISIEGGPKAGKSILAKYLCLYFAKEFVPIYLDEGMFSLNDNKKILVYALENQYGTNADYDFYCQLENKKKILIVDRNDKVKKDRWESFLQSHKNNFGHIILFGGIDWNINIKERALENLTENNYIYLKISPFYYSKRKELITKIYKQITKEDDVHVSKKINKINEEITNQIKYFQLNPDFILQYVIYYINFIGINTLSGGNVFNKVFEGNITFRISNNTDKENVSEILIALDYVAKKIHFNRLYPLPIEKFKEAINEYNEDYDNILNPKKVYDIALNSKIIKEVNEKFAIVFTDENYLSYFVASHLNRAFNEGKCKEELQYILNNICFGINGDIILFLSYITSNTQILIPILENIINHMNEWRELDIGNKNIEYLTRPIKPIIGKLPNKKDKEDFDKEKSEAEKELVENKSDNIESLYSYDETKVNTFENKITKSLNYLNLVAKILPNFRQILTKQQKETIVHILYTYPNKLLYIMLKDVDDNLNNIVKEILSNNPKTKRGLLITQDMFIKSLQTQSMCYILGIYDFIASTSATEKTMLELNNKFDFNQNINYKLQNIMMEENSGSFHRMVSKAEKLFDETDIGIVKQMIYYIVKKYFLTHDEPIDNSEMQHTISKFFGDDNQKRIKLIHAKNRYTKK